MTEAPLAAQLEARYGLDLAALPADALEHALDERGAARGLSTRESYLALLSREEEEWQALAECLVVGETWFMRDEVQLADVSRWANAQRRANTLIRALSAPCSTGEEAYSLAAVLLEAGIPAARIEVIGLDLARSALQQAESARYPLRAWRSPQALPSWLRQDHNDLCPSDAVRRCVRFCGANLMDSLGVESLGPFDLVLSRNFLIYLSPAGRQRWAETLCRTLAPGGLVLTGQAEWLSAMDPRFAPAAGFSPITFQRAAAVKPSAPTSRPVRNALAPARPRARKTVAPSVARSTVEESSERFARVQALADQGLVDQALASLGELLERYPTEASGHFLAGLLAQAKDRPRDAEHYFERTLYLQPAHREALEHLRALAEKRGALDRANRLRQRLARLGQRDRTTT